MYARAGGERAAGSSSRFCTSAPMPIHGIWRGAGKSGGIQIPEARLLAVDDNDV